MSRSSSNRPTPPRPSRAPSEPTITVETDTGNETIAEMPPEHPPPPPSRAEAKPARAETKQPPPLPAPPVPFFRDPLCAEQARHRPMCDCKGEARKPIA